MFTTARKFLLTTGAMLALGAGGVVHAQMINLGAASGFVGLDLSTSAFQISKSTTVVTGNLGVVTNGNFSFSGGGTVNGTLYAGYGASITDSGGSTITGGIVQPTTSGGTSLANQAATDALSAANYYGGLSANLTLSTLTGTTNSGAPVGSGQLQVTSNSGSSTETISSTGGLQVIDITGNLYVQNSTLVLSGNSSSTYVFNIDGEFDLSRTTMQLQGISADQVLFNLIGTGAKVVTSGDSGTDGIFLAANGSIDIQGGTHDSDFIAGNSLTFESGVSITSATTALAVQPVPELSTTLMALGAGVLFLALAGLKSRAKRLTVAA